MRGLLALLLVCPLVGAEPAKSLLFERQTGAYAVYRIPGIVVTKAGTVLAYTEARKSERGDWGETDILLRRSTDSGQNWSAPTIIGRMPGPFSKNPVAVEKKIAGEGVLYNNPVAIADSNGAVHFVFVVEYMRAFYMRSDDDGKTFSKPVEITAAFESFRPNIDWKVIATGPGHGIQLRNGRLLIPVWLSLGTGGGGHGSSVTATIYSDNGGKTWKAGDIAVPNTEEFVSPNETAAVELSNGHVMLNVRSPSKAHRRILVQSKDGATNWSRPEFHPQLVEPICFGSMARLSRNRILFVNPDNLERADGKNEPGISRDRKNVTVWLSYDDGKTWPVKRSVEPGSSAYADLTVLPDETILCLYETRGSLTLARLTLDWLTDGKDHKL